MVTWLRRRLADRGATTIVLTILMSQGALLGVGALVVDVGNLLSEREQLQSGADAAAHAVANSCVAGGCRGGSAGADQRARAERYADRNAKDGHAQVVTVCGRWDDLPGCPAPTTGMLTRCLNTPAPTDTYVEVWLRTETADGSTALPTVFGATLGDGSYHGKAVHACARVTATIEAPPAPVALWAGSVDAGALTFNSSIATVTGLLHSNADVTVNGSLINLPDGSEYVTAFTVRGSLVTAPNPKRVAVQALTGTTVVAAYRPGGSQAGGATYHAVPPASCVSGTWSVAPADVPAGIVYVPCAITVTGNGAVHAMIVAEDAILFRGAGMTVDPGVPGSPALVSGSNSAAAIQIAGSDIHVLGAIEAVDGGVDLASAAGRYPCGVIADTIVINGSDSVVGTGDSCVAGGGRTTTRLTG